MKNNKQAFVNSQFFEMIQIQNILKKILELNLSFAYIYYSI